MEKNRTWQLQIVPNECLQITYDRIIFCLPSCSRPPRKKVSEPNDKRGEKWG